MPENVPAWLQTIDKYAWDTIFFLFAGKAYATFSLLFGFSFYIQFHNAEKRGIDFRGRFAWRMCLLLLFAQLHALFYNGDILLLYAVVGFALIPVCKLKDKTVFWIALFCFYSHTSGDRCHLCADKSGLCGGEPGSFYSLCYAC